MSVTPHAPVVVQFERDDFCPRDKLAISEELYQAKNNSQRSNPDEMREP